MSEATSSKSVATSSESVAVDQQAVFKNILTGEWVIDHTSAKQRRVIHYWLTILWLTVGLGIWIVLRDALWFVGFMSLYAIWITHLAGWAAETPVEGEST